MYFVIEIEKAKEGLVAKKVTANRKGKSYETTVYVNPNKVSGKLYYHGTVASVVDSILKKGIVPGDSKNHSFGDLFYDDSEGKGRSKSVYVSSSLDHAIWYAMHGYENRLQNTMVWTHAKERKIQNLLKNTKYAIVEVDMPVKDKKFKRDEKSGGTGTSFRYEGKIKSENIKSINVYSQDEMHKLHKKLNKAENKNYFVVGIILPDGYEFDSDDKIIEK
ncbi:hypothetical protein CCP3SC1AL1_320029 [Gammaproteobacteria bacterium]